MKKDKVILMVLVALVISAIVFINSVKNNGNYSEEVMNCIADKSVLIISKTCGHCANQKSILGKDLDKFELLDIGENPELWEEYELKGIPTWIINGKTYAGVKQISTLKELTNC